MIRLPLAWRKIVASRVTGMTAAVDQIAQDIARPDTRQLIDIANQHEVGVRSQRFEDVIKEHQIEHRGFVDHQHVDRQRGVFIVDKALSRLNPSIR